MDQSQLNWITHFIWSIADDILRDVYVRGRYLKDAVVEIDRSLEAITREIALMQEYRTRLTADLETGKLNVHGAAAKLPEAVASTSDLSDPSDESDLAEETTAEEES